MGHTGCIMVLLECRGKPSRPVRVNLGALRQARLTDKSNCLGRFQEADIERPRRGKKKTFSSSSVKSLQAPMQQL